MNDLSTEQQKQIAKSVVDVATPAEKDALRRWIESLLAIRATNLPALVQAGRAVSATAKSEVIFPLIKSISRQLTPEALRQLSEQLVAIRQSDASRFAKSRQALALVGRSLKKAGWDERGLAARLGLSSAVVTAVVFGSQGAGIAALGGAIGVPLWVIFGAGATFIGVLYEELTGKPPAPKTTYRTIDAEREN